jgi:hypothetical protein
MIPGGKFYRDGHLEDCRQDGEASSGWMRHHGVATVKSVGVAAVCADANGKSISEMALLSILMDIRTTAPSFPATNRVFITPSLEPSFFEGLSWAAGTKKSKRDRPRREIPPGGSVTTRAIIGTSQPVFMMSDVNQCAGPGADDKAEDDGDGAVPQVKICLRRGERALKVCCEEISSRGGRKARQLCRGERCSDRFETGSKNQLIAVGFWRKA